MGKAECNMSTIYFLACEDCKEMMAVGQHYSTIWSGEPKVLEDLGKFLYKHKREDEKPHHLFYASEHFEIDKDNIQLYDYKNFD
jgi:hypothetical protein